MEVITNRVKRLVPKSAFTRSVAILTGGNALGQVIVVLASPLLTRLYTPEQIGMVAAFTSLLMVLLAVATWLYEMAIPLPEDKKRAMNLLVLSIIVVLFMTVMTGKVIALFGEHIAAFVNSPALKPYLWLLPAALLGAGVNQALNYWAVREKGFKCVAKTRLHESLATVCTQLGLGGLKWGTAGLLIGIVVGRLVGNIALLHMIFKNSRDVIKTVSVKAIGKVAYRYRRFPLISSWSSLLNAVTFQLPNILLAVFYGPFVLGWVALAQRVLGLPFNLLGTSVGQVYLAEAARIKHDPQKLKALFWKTVKHMTALGLPVVGLIALTAPWVFYVVFGPSWEEAGRYLQAMALMFFMQLVATPVRGTLYVLERQDLHLYCEVVRIALQSGALFLAAYLDQSAMMAIVWFGMAGAVGNMLPALFAWIGMSVHFRRQKTEGIRNE